MIHHQIFILMPESRGIGVVMLFFPTKSTTQKGNGLLPEKS